MTATVAVVGSANLDLVVAVPRHPRGGETLLGGDLREAAGGKGANQAVAAARAGGAETVFVGAVGHDAHAEQLITSLRTAGVTLDVLQRVQAPTGVALITVSADGENAIVVAPGANSALRIDAAQTEAIANARVVLAQLEVPIDQIIAAARARSADALFVLNAAPAQALPDELFAELDVLIVNEHEAAELTGNLPDASIDERAQALSERVATVIVTLGSAGVVIATGGDAPSLTTLPAFRVDAVDTTGAGDTFCGVLAARLALGDDLTGAVTRATAASALAVTRPGAQDAVPSVAEVAEFLNEKL